MSSFTGIIGSLTVAIWILLLVRNHKIMLKFALPWLFLAIFSLIFSIGSEIRYVITELLGFAQPSNAFFAVAIVALAFLGILLSVEATSATDRLERAASAIAISNVVAGGTMSLDQDDSNQVCDQEK
jgi:hypothetical protein